MRKILAVLLLLVCPAVFAGVFETTTTSGEVKTNKSTKTKTKTGKKGSSHHKGGKKSKKNSGSTTPPPK